jgi:hypothetical protein
MIEKVVEVGTVSHIKKTNKVEVGKRWFDWEGKISGRAIAKVEDLLVYDGLALVGSEIK